MKHLLCSLLLFMTPIFVEGLVFTVTNTADYGDGSFRQAIHKANQNPGSSITFNIEGKGPHTIKPLSQLPIILSARTIIDGTTQQGFTKGPQLILNGDNSPAEIGLIVVGNACIIKGLTVQHFKNAGILILGPQGNTTISGCYVGTDESGSAPASNGYGIRILGSSNNTIGGQTTNERNIIAGNKQSGIDIQTAGRDISNNSIKGNYIGIAANGQLEVPNKTAGITLGSNDGSYVKNTIIGGTTSESNMINHDNGIFIGTNAINNTIDGNFIGTERFETPKNVTESSELGSVSSSELNSQTLLDEVVEHHSNLTNTDTFAELTPSASTIIPDKPGTEQPQEKEAKAPTSLIVTISQVAETPLCPTGSTQLIADVSGAVSNLLKFEWSDGLTEIVPTPHRRLVNHWESVYYVKVTDPEAQQTAYAEWCTIDARSPQFAWLKALPSPTLAGTILNLEITEGTAPFTITWTDGFSQTVHGKRIERLVAPEFSTDYLAEIVDVNGCKTVAGPVNVSVLPLTASLTANKPQICQGQFVDLKVTFNSSTAVKIRWSDNYTQEHITTSPIIRKMKPLKTTPYWVEIENQNGHKVKQSLRVIVHPAVKGIITRKPSKVCSGECTPIDFAIQGGTPPFKVKWSDAPVYHAFTHLFGRQLKHSVCPFKTTPYSFTVIDANQCVSAPVATTVTVAKIAKAIKKK